MAIHHVSLLAKERIFFFFLLNGQTDYSFCSTSISVNVSIMSPT